MLWVVTKSPVGISAEELIGVFTTAAGADAAVLGPGTYFIAKVTPNRRYSTGQLLDVEVRVVTSVDSLGVKAP